MWADLAGLTARCAAAHQRQAYAAARQVRSWLFHARPRRCWKAQPGRMSRGKGCAGCCTGAAEKGVGGTADRRAATGRSGRGWRRRLRGGHMQHADVRRAQVGRARLLLQEEHARLVLRLVCVLPARLAVLPQRPPLHGLH